MQMISYLTFSGNCREAMTFYKECLGGKLSLQTIGESAKAAQIPEKIKEYILQAKLSGDGFAIMGSDMTPETGLQKGNAVSIFLNCGSAREIRSTFDKLAKGGKVLCP